MKPVRLDKYLSASGERTRSEAIRLIRSGLVTLNGLPVKDASAKVTEGDSVLLAGKAVGDSSLQYYMLYKPAGVLTASRDMRAGTVMDLVPEALYRREVFPVGRLDKDTTGLLLLTNDGDMAHILLHPKHHVAKHYIAKVEGQLSQKDVDLFARGIELKDFTAKPATLTILSADDECSTAEVILGEGKFHQVKRMFAYCGHEVLTLHRSSFGPLILPSDMKPGDWRELNADEIARLKKAISATGEE